MTAISRPLDFIVFGVPRSGTKGLVRALNLHPDVYCAMERFHYTVNHAGILFPDSFVNSQDLWDARDLSKIKLIKAELAQKTDVRQAGNKLPRYYFALERINKEVPSLKNVWIYRSPYGFMPSWNRRERDSVQGQWPAGQIALFGLLELFVCIEACLCLPKDIFVFSYDHGLGCSSDLTLRALEFLGVDTAVFDRPAFETQQRKKQERLESIKRSDQDRLVLQEHEEELLSTLRIKELDAIIAQDGGILLSEIVGPLGDFLEGIRASLPGAFDRAFKACINSNVASFGHQYFRRNRTELKCLLNLARGSSILAGFQRLTPYDRLKALYVQRFALKSRLSALRLPR